jgi:hypothetical protein
VAKPSPEDVKDVEEAARMEDPNPKSIARIPVVRTTVVRTTTTAASTAPAATQSMLGLTQNVTRLLPQPGDPFTNESDLSNVRDRFTNVKDWFTNVWDQCHLKA